MRPDVLTATDGALEKRGVGRGGDDSDVHVMHGEDSGHVHYEF